MSHSSFFHKYIMAKIDKNTPVEFIETTSTKLTNVQEEHPGAFIHVNDENGDDVLYIGEDKVTDKLNVGDEDLSGTTIQVGNFNPGTYGVLKNMTVSEIIREIFRPVSVSSVSLNKTSHTCEVGDNYTLIATVSPSNATNKTVSWSSDDTTIVTVNSSGKITAEKVGSATITAMAGGKSATCLVTVRPTVPTHQTEISASISYTGPGLITVGEILPTESLITISISDGMWSDGTPIAGGHSSLLEISKDNVPVVFGSISEEGIYTISGTVTFTEGEKPKDNDNPPTEYDAYPGGTINTNTIIIKVVNPVQINGYYTDGEDDGYDVTVMRDYVIDYFSDTLYTLYITIPDEIEDALGKFKIYLPYEFETFEVKQLNKMSGNYDIGVEMIPIEGEELMYIRKTKTSNDMIGSAEYEIKLKR